MFEAILEECSMKDIVPEEPEEHQEAILDHPLPAEREGTWFWLHEAPFEPVEEIDHTQEALSLEFRRVKSLREEQETKIAMFLREDKYKSRAGPDSMKNESPVGKYSQSLSPRKTKKIDKLKQVKLTQESCWCQILITHPLPKALR